MPLILSRFPLRLFGLRWLANLLAWKVCRKHRIDRCFVHMSMEWVYRLKPTFFFLNIPVLLWYAHGSVSWRLRLAHKMSDRVVTSTRSGFRLKSDKLRIIGQGIDTRLFALTGKARDKHLILSVGRISRRKKIDTLLAVLKCLNELPGGEHYRLRLVGGTLTRDDQSYLHDIKSLIEQMGLSDRVEFAGHVNRENLPAEYQRAAIQVNVSSTGSMDKTVLEGLACGCPTLTSNVAFRDLLSAGMHELFIEEVDPCQMAKRIDGICRGNQRYSEEDLRAIVTNEHDIRSYIDKVVSNIMEL